MLFKMFRKLMKTRNLIKLFCFSIFGFICMLQVYTIARTFFKYPEKITNYDNPIQLLESLPGITLCNNNRISLKKLMQRNPLVANAVTKKFPDYFIRKEPQIGKDFYDYRNELHQLLLSLNYSSSEDKRNSTMNELFNMIPDTKPFIKKVECARTWSDTLECDKVSQVDSIHERRCITFLHLGALYHDSINRPELFNNYDPKEGETGTYFETKDVIKFTLDFNPEDYADLKRQIGARLIIHSNNFVGTVTDLDYFVTRGYSYEFSIDRIDSVLLGPPYDLCSNFYTTNLEKFADSINPRIPLYGETCYQNCAIRHMIHIYKCWPPTVPYFRNDSLDPDLDLKVCSWSEVNIPIFREFANETQSEEANELLNTYMKIRRYCLGKCVLPCRIVRYVVTPSKSVWPSDVQLMFDKTGKMRRRRHCCAEIRIKYLNHYYKVQQYLPRYNLLDVVQDIGGILAVWLGLSIISVFHAVQKLADMCARHSSRAIVKIHHDLDDGDESDGEEKS